MQKFKTPKRLKKQEIEYVTYHMRGVGRDSDLCQKSVTYYLNNLFYRIAIRGRQQRKKVQKQKRDHLI